LGFQGFASEHFGGLSPTSNFHKSLPPSGKLNDQPLAFSNGITAIDLSMAAAGKAA
jgi:hypothetical protein